MKTKAKLLLAISTLSAVVLAAGVTSTFAWFTTQAKATLTTGTMTVSTVSNITITVTKLAYDTGTTTTNFGSGTTSASDSGVALGPVSSVDGLTFYAPKALRSGETGDVYLNSDMAAVGTIEDWKTTHAYSNDYVGYVKYGIRVQANADTGTARTLKYKITPTVSDGKLQACYRVALHNSASGYAASSAQKGLFSNTAGAKAAYKSSVTSDTALDTSASYTTTAISTVASPVNLTNASGAAITTGSNIDEYLIFSVWVDGVDSNATNDNIAGKTLTVDIEFSLV